MTPISMDPCTQLLPNLVDHYAKTKPEAVYAEYPVNPLSYDDGYRPITYKAFANAINGLAHWLTNELGPGHGEMLAYLGPNDLRYPALVLGAVKAGYCMFLTSPRNSIAAHQSLLDKLKCTTLLASNPRLPFVAAILDAIPLTVIDVPDVEDLLATEYPVFEYSKSYPKDASDRLLVLHTSGSTGIPKPIIWTHDSAVKHMHMQKLEVPIGHEGQDRKGFGKRMYLTLPPFHAAGIGHFLIVTMPVGATLIIPTSGGLPTATALVAARKQTHFDYAIVVPSIIKELAHDPEALDYCSSHLEYLIYSGGDLPQMIGDTVASKLPLMNGYGASELGILSVTHSPIRDPLKDWRYLQFHPELGVEYRHVSGEEHEVVLVRTPERQCHQFPFTIFPDRQEYRTNDLMVPHPTKAGLWRPSSRLDDVIVFLNGEKTNPVSMEQHIVAANSEVTGCLVVGAQRFQASLLVELEGQTLSTSERAAMIEKLWPSIEEANIPAPAHARISKSHILFTSSEKPMLRAAKGTVQRASTLVLYALELDNLYADADKLAQLDASSSPGPGGVDDVAQVTSYIRDSILAITGWSADKLSDKENWFNLGLDSLQAITATRVLKQGLNVPTLTPNVIYLHPTVVGLTQALRNLHKECQETTEAKIQGFVEERNQLLKGLIEGIKPPKAQRSEALPDSQTVILTGRARERQQERLTSFGLDFVLDEARVTFWKSDLSKTEFGLQPEQFEELQQTATTIIHNAWTVDFNLSLASFKPNLTSVLNLINFSGQATYSPQMFFISSMSSVMGLRTDNGLTPEEIIETELPAPNGYANSKYISEHLLAHAAQQGFNLSFARVGQVAGSIRAQGLWNKSEWFPSLVISSFHLKALPETLGEVIDRVDWMPIDLLAEILVDLSLLKSSGLSVYHPMNLHPLSWKKDIRSVVEEALAAQGKTVEVIPSQEWILRVRRDLECTRQDKNKELQIQLAKNPAAKLIDFFEVVGNQTETDNSLDTRVTARVSEKLREVDAVKPEWIQKWVNEWVH
ncbi:acetyl-CoA synthetase-like protein [Penicillium verhagenii]|nr:acetyl-CoA synthetase-like protein [Penicillium verhagenii]